VPTRKPPALPPKEVADFIKAVEEFTDKLGEDKGIYDVGVVTTGLAAALETMRQAAIFTDCLGLFDDFVNLGKQIAHDAVVGKLHRLPSDSEREQPYK